MRLISECTQKQEVFIGFAWTTLIMVILAISSFAVLGCQGGEHKAPQGVEGNERIKALDEAVPDAEEVPPKPEAALTKVGTTEQPKPEVAFPKPVGSEGTVPAEDKRSDLSLLSEEAILYYLKESYVPAPQKKQIKGSEALMDKLRVSFLGVKARRCWQRIRATGEWLETANEIPAEVKARQRILSMVLTVQANDDGDPVERPKVIFGDGKEPRLAVVAKCLGENAWPSLPVTAPPPAPDPETGVSKSYHQKKIVIPWVFAAPLDDAKKGFMCGFGPRTRFAPSNNIESPADKKDVYPVYQVVLKTLFVDAEELVVAVSTQVPDEPGNFASPPPTADEKVALIQGRVPQIKESTIASFRKLRPPPKQLANAFGLEAPVAMATRTQLENFLGSKNTRSRRGWRCFEELYPRGFYVRLSDIAFDDKKSQAFVHVTLRKSWSWFTREYMLLEKRGSAWHLLERFPAHRF